MPDRLRASVARRFLILLMACAALVGGGVSAAGAAPAQVSTDRSLRLVGAPNARDIGGYTTADGRTVKSGLVFRTDALNALTPADLNELEARDVTVVDDLRTIYERSLQPDRIPPRSAANWRDVLGGSPITNLIDLPSAYRAFITGPGASAAFAAVLRDIQNADGATVYHCSAGKDRTGWMTAVLLTILGVDRATVDADYLLSNTFRHANPNDPINGVNLGLLKSAFDTAIAEYGSFENYVSRGLGLTDKDVAQLQAKLLS